VFLLKGKKQRVGYNDTFLKQEGCAVGSTVVMMKNAYITEDAWEEMTPSLVDGYQSLPVICDNPQWWMIEIFDGFGVHLNNLSLMKKRADAKILSIKEEGDSSSYNQAYDKHVAKSDKHPMRHSLTFLWSMKNRNSNLVDQWDLIHCGLASIQYSDRNRGVWISSFVSVNFHPMRQITYAEWCKNLESFMQAADSFNLIMQSEQTDKYTLLPLLWQVMPPVDKKTAVAIVEHFGEDARSVECCGELIKALKICLADLTLLQPCIFLAIDNPLHLDRGLEEVIDKITVNAPNADVSAIAAIETVCNKANTGLKMMQHNPDGLTGIELFEHQVRFRQRDFSKKEGQHKISDYLVISP
jgi:hypothetical protein